MAFKLTAFETFFKNENPSIGQADLKVAGGIHVTFPS